MVIFYFEICAIIYDMETIDNKSLYEKQKETLDKFLKSGAIDKKQYEKSLNTLKEKMGIKD